MEVGTTTNNNLTARLPLLNPGDYDLWLMRIEQYFLMTDYSLWEVIKNGNKVLKRMVGTVEQEYEPTSVEEKQERRNEMKARATLLMALPNKDQLKFHTYQDAKLLMEAIEKRYGGNKESKKVTKIHWTVGDLRRSDQSRRYELKVAENTNNTNNTHKADDSSHEISSTQSTTHTHHNGSNTVCLDNLCDAVICAFLAKKDLQWEMAMLTIRARRFIKRTGKQLNINGQRVGFDKSKVECFKCHKHGPFARECSSSSSESEVDSCSKTCVKAYASLNEQYDNLSSDYKKYQFNLVSYKAGLKSVEARLVHYKKNEIVLEDSINVLKLEVRLRDNALDVYKLNLEKAKAERDQLKQTLEKFQNSSKSLNEILECQVIDKFKKGLGYNAATAASPTVEGFVNLTDKSRTNKAYHAVSLPLTGNFIPCKPNLTFIDEIVESENLDVTTIVTPSNDKTVADRDISNIIESNAVRMDNTSAPINEDWNSDDESKIDYTIVPSFEKTKSVKTVREIDAAKQNPRGNQRNWNNLMSQRLGNDFKMTNKACYTCGSFEHLHYVCDKKVARPTWNNSKRVNQKNFSNKMSHPHPKRSFVPKAVLTRYFANKNSISKTNVNTVSVKHTTTRDKAVVRNKGKGANAVKASACWVWKAKNINASTTFKKFSYIDARCRSKHMTRNKCYLDEYEDYDGGLVSFGDGKGRISGKGKIKTGTLDFEDVYFCKELKYNLFSVSQICD
ncbi:hypothetical protein Tco_1282804 [Tanacetum coccineum]